MTDSDVRAREAAEEDEGADAMAGYEEYLTGELRKLYLKAAPGAGLGAEIRLARARLAQALLADDDAKIGSRIDVLAKLMQLSSKKGEAPTDLLKLLGPIREEVLGQRERD